MMMRSRASGAVERRLLGGRGPTWSQATAGLRCAAARAPPALCRGSATTLVALRRFTSSSSTSRVSEIRGGGTSLFSVRSLSMLARGAQRMTASPALLELLAVAGMGAALAIDTVAPQAKELHAADVESFVRARVLSCCGTALSLVSSGVALTVCRNLSRVRRTGHIVVAGIALYSLYGRLDLLAWNLNSVAAQRALPLSNTSTLTLGEVRLFDQQLAPRGVTLSTVVTALKPALRWHRASNRRVLVAAGEGVTHVHVVLHGAVDLILPDDDAVDDGTHWVSGGKVVARLGPGAMWTDGMAALGGDDAAAAAAIVAAAKGGEGDAVSNAERLPTPAWPMRSGVTAVARGGGDPAGCVVAAIPLAHLARLRSAASPGEAALAAAVDQSVSASGVVAAALHAALEPHGGSVGSVHAGDGGGATLSRWRRFAVQRAFESANATEEWLGNQIAAHGWSTDQWARGSLSEA